MNSQPKQIVERLRHLTADAPMIEEHYERILETFKIFVVEMDKFKADEKMTSLKTTDANETTNLLQDTGSLKRAKLNGHKKDFVKLQ
jgi:hypothetical protein